MIVIDECLVSVIVVTYNSSDTIIRTLNSIKDQTYKELELIITDDCSQDSTVKDVRKWLETNKKRFCSVRVLKAKRNHGVVKNCNIGASVSKGKYIQFFAGDDIMVSDAIEKKVALAEKSSISYVFSRVRVIGKDKNKVEAMKEFCDRGYSIIEKGRETQWNEIIKNNYIAGPSGSFILRSFFFKQGMFDLKYSMLEDYPFIFKYIKKGNKIVLLDEELAYYNITDTSLCTSGNYRFLKSSLLFFICERLPLLLKYRMFSSIYDNSKYFIYYIIYHFFPTIIERYEKNKNKNRM
jgi:alpha-1,3-rhamnosyltransferase